MHGLSQLRKTPTHKSELCRGQGWKDAHTWRCACAWSLPDTVTSGLLGPSSPWHPWIQRQLPWRCAASWWEGSSPLALRCARCQLPAPATHHQDTTQISDARLTKKWWLAFLVQTQGTHTCATLKARLLLHRAQMSAASQRTPAVLCNESMADRCACAAACSGKQT